MGKRRPSVGYSLWQLQHRQQLILERRLATLRLSLPQAATLTHLHDEPGISSAELARRLLLTPQAISLLISRLEAAGYLARAAPTTGRSQPLTLTSTGQSVIAEVNAISHSVHEDVFGALNASERAQLQELLDRSLARATALPDAAG